MSYPSVLASIPTPLLVLATPFALVALLLTWTKLFTSFRYHRAVAPFLEPPEKSKNAVLPPPRLPYTIPYVGNAREFLNPKPGSFWVNLFKTHPRETGACTLMMGGRENHLLFSPTAVQTMFNSKKIGATRSDTSSSRNCFAMSNEDIARSRGLNEKGERRDWKGEGRAQEDPLYLTEKLNTEKLIKSDAVNDMTNEFMRVFREELDLMYDKLEGPIGVVELIRILMFKSSGHAFMGARIFQEIPDYAEQFWAFDHVMMPLYFGVSRNKNPAVYDTRDKIISSFERYHNNIQAEGKAIEPDGEFTWEPTYGSRANRARQLLFQQLKMSNKGRGGMDLAFTFALNSNAIPSAAWALLHILNPNGPPDLLPRVLAEIETAKMPSGDLNISTLCGLPLLQSIYQEVLRLYGDVMVTRDLTHDITLPISENKDKPRSVMFNAGSKIMAPTWPYHRDPALWDVPGHGANDFYAERFLTTHPETGQDMFTLTGRAGKLFPYGGGKSICPGRVFAKQEILGAVATLLAKFDFEPTGFCVKDGKSSDKFPQIRAGLGGAGIMNMDGDMKVKVKRRD